MSEQGYIYLDRSLCNHWLWQCTFSEGQAWIDILYSANFKEQKQMDRYKKLEVIKRGSFVTSLSILSSKWRWGRRRVQSFLQLLEQDGMITVRSDSRGTLITVCNYDKYQKKSASVQYHKKTANGTGDSTGDSTRDRTGDGTGNVQLLSNGINSNKDKRKESKPASFSSHEKDSYNPLGDRLKNRYGEPLKKNDDTKSPVYDSAEISTLSNSDFIHWAEMEHNNRTDKTFLDIAESEFLKRLGKKHISETEFLDYYVHQYGENCSYKSVRLAIEKNGHWIVSELSNCNMIRSILNKRKTT